MKHTPRFAAMPPWRPSPLFLLAVLVFIVSNVTLAQWVQTNGPYGADARCLAVFPAGVETGRSDLFVGTYGGGVFLSTDNGTSWTAVDSGMTSADIRTFAVSPTGDGTGRRLDSSSSMNLFAGTWGGGVFLSTDNGTSWAAVNSGLTSIYVDVLAFSGTNLFAGTYGDGVFLSTDNGTSWTAVNSGLAISGVATLVYSFAVIDTNLFAATLDGVFRSTNNGTSWTAVDSGLTTINVPSLAVLPNGAGGTDLFAATSGGGVFRSTDNGTSWTPTAPPTPYPYDRFVGAIPNGAGGMSLYMTTGSESFLSTDNGASWTVAALNGCSNFAFSDNGTGGVNLFAGAPGGVYRSTDYGTSWTLSNEGLTNTYVGTLAASPHGAGPTNLFAVTGGLFRSTDEGASWTSVDSALNGGVTSIAVSANGAGRRLSTRPSVDSSSGTNIFAAGTFNGHSGGVYVSTDNGASWADPGPKLALKGAMSLAAAPDGSNLFAWTQRGAVYRSTDNARSWTAVFSGTSTLFDLTIAPDGAGGTNVLLCDKHGVSRSTDNGTSWTAVNSGLEGAEVRRFAVSPDGTCGVNIFAGAYRYHGGPSTIFLSTDNGTSWTDLDVSATNATTLGEFCNGVGGKNLFTASWGGHIFLSTNDGTSWTDIGLGLPNSNVGSLAVSDSNLFAAISGRGVWKWPLSQISNYSAINLNALGGSSSPSGAMKLVGRTSVNGTGMRVLPGTIKSSLNNLTAAPANGEIVLLWTKDHHPDFMHYRIYADTLPHQLTLIDSAAGGVTDTARIIRGLANGKTYYFRITAVDNTGFENNYSNEVVASPDMIVAKPMLTAVPGNKQVLLRWSKDHHADFMHYCIYGDTFPHPVTLIDSSIVGVNDTTKVIQGLTNGTIYYFRLMTVDGVSLESDTSNEVAVKPGTFIFPVNNGWNMVALSFTVHDCRKSCLYPFAVSDAYCFEGAYFNEDTLLNCIGYWLKFNGNQYVSLDGDLRVEDTIIVEEGWNMVGSISSPLAAADLTSDPGGIMTSQFWDYDGSYLTSDSIRPGKAYWVKMSEGGKLILSSTSAPSASQRIRIVRDSELPPEPPGGHRTVVNVPKDFALEQNYPNPFNPSTTINYQLPVRSHVTLKVYDLLGREVATLVESVEEAGYKSVRWDASGISSGIYCYRLTAGNFVRVNKMVILR